MRRREFLGLVIAASSRPGIALAQQARAVPRVGYLIARAGPTPFDGAFREALLEHGYVEGRDLVIEPRYVVDPERLPAAAAELVSLGVSVLVASTAPAIEAARKATTTIPIVMVQSQDPVRAGFVASLARPGGNITGLSTLAPELSAKRLDILREVLPAVKRVAVLWNASDPANAFQLQEIEAAAREVGLEIYSAQVRAPEDIDGALADAARAGARAFITLSDGFTFGNRSRITSSAIRHRLPGMFANRFYTVEGGLLSYGPIADRNFRRAAFFVDRILKGASPANMPVEQPTAFELVINLKTARALDLDVSPALLARADEVIE